MDWRFSVLLAGPPGEPERLPAASLAQATHLLVHHVNAPPRRRDRDDRRAVAVSASWHVANSQIFTFLPMHAPTRRLPSGVNAMVSTPLHDAGGSAMNS